MGGVELEVILFMLKSVYDMYKTIAASHEKVNKLKEKQKIEKIEKVFASLPGTIEETTNKLIDDYTKKLSESSETSEESLDTPNSLGAQMIKTWTAYSILEASLSSSLETDTDSELETKT